MISVNKIKEYPHSLILPFFKCCFFDVLSLNGQKNIIHQKFRIPAFKSFNDRLVDIVYNENKSIIDKIDYTNSVGIKSQTAAPIWVMWLQGEDNAPELVRMCIASIRKNSSNHPVILITADNLDSYVHLPSYIIEKHMKGLITHTHFSDIVRAALLAEHGGLWMDSTLYLHKPLEDWIFECPFFSSRRNDKDTFYRYPNPVWSGFFLGSFAKSPLMEAFRDALYSHWKTANSIPSYFYIDYIFAAMRKYTKGFSAAIEAVPFNNPKITKLMNIINHPYSSKVLAEYVDKDNFVSKLSYKRKVEKETKDNRLTFYGKLMDMSGL